MNIGSRHLPALRPLFPEQREGKDRPVSVWAPMSHFSLHVHMTGVHHAPTSPRRRGGGWGTLAVGRAGCLHFAVWKSQTISTARALKPSAYKKEKG